MTEAAFQKRVLKRLRESGWLTFPVAGRNVRGVPDVVAMRDGRTVWIELKTDQGRPSPHQLEMLADMRDREIECGVLRPRTFEKFYSTLESGVRFD